MCTFICSNTLFIGNHKAYLKIRYLIKIIVTAGVNRNICCRADGICTSMVLCTAFSNYIIRHCWRKTVTAGLNPVRLGVVVRGGFDCTEHRQEIGSLHIPAVCSVAIGITMHTLHPKNRTRICIMPCTDSLCSCTDRLIPGCISYGVGIVGLGLAVDIEHKGPFHKGRAACR